MEEVFKKINLGKFTYSISNLGRIFNGGKELKLGTPNSHYHFILDFRDGKPKKAYTHRLICELFIPNPKNKRCVNHKNGNKWDNRIDNLEWVTHSENNKHAYDNGMKEGVKGAKNSRHVILEQFDLDGNYLKTFFGLRAASRELGLGDASISACAKGRQKTAYGFKWKYKTA